MLLYFSANCSGVYTGKETQPTKMSESICLSGKKHVCKAKLLVYFSRTCIIWISSCLTRCLKSIFPSDLAIISWKYDGKKAEYLNILVNRANEITNLELQNIITRV